MPGSIASGPWIRDFIRAQFSPDSRHEIRLWEMGGGEKKQGPNVQTFAQVPVLNQQQVVSVWKWTVPAHEQWESLTVAVPVSDKGVYLVEATDGKLRAYTIVVITEIAIITKAGPGRLMSFVVDRRSGDPIAGMLVRGLDRSERSCVEDHRRARAGRHAHQRRQAGERRRAGHQRRSVRHQHAGRVEPGQRSRSQPEGLHLHRSSGVSSRRHGALQDHRARADRERLQRSRKARN